MDSDHSENSMNFITNKNQYFLDILLPPNYQKDGIENLELLQKKTNIEEEQFDNNQNTSYLDQFERFYKENPDLNSFPDEAYVYINNFDLLHVRGYFDWLTYIEIFMDYENLSEDLEIFVKHVLEDAEGLNKLKSIRYDIDLDKLEGQKLCILKNGENEYLIQAVSEESLQKFDVSPVFVQREFQKTEIQDCAYIYKTKKLNKNEAQFLKSLFSILKSDNKIHFPTLLKKQYYNNQDLRMYFVKKIQQKILDEQKEYKNLKTQTSCLKLYQLFLDLCFYFRTFKQNFTNFPTIQKEIDFFLKHSNVFQNKKKDQLMYFQNDVESVFEEFLNQNKKYVIESDCAICFSCDASNSNNVIYCTKCGQGAHTKCLVIKEVPENDFYCGSCPDEKKNVNNICYFCKKKDFILLSKEKERGTGEIHYHLICMLMLKRWDFLSNTQQSNLNIQRNKMPCILCEKNEYTENLLQCVDCNKFIHPLCAYKEGYYFHMYDLDKQKFDDFKNGFFEYKIKIYCDNCDLEKHHPDLMQQSKNDYQKLIQLNKHYRQLSISPSYFQQHLESENLQGIKENENTKQFYIKNIYLKRIQLTITQINFNTQIQFQQWKQILMKIKITIFQNQKIMIIFLMLILSG